MATHLTQRLEAELASVRKRQHSDYNQAVKKEKKRTLHRLTREKPSRQPTRR